MTLDHYDRACPVLRYSCNPFASWAPNPCAANRFRLLPVDRIFLCYR